jgi:hypothetical protein
MPKSKRLDKVYAELLGNHPEGHAIYKLVTTAQIKPGACGYFDSEGDWNSIIQLSDAEALNRGEWTQLKEELKIDTDPGADHWGPKCSQDVSGVQLGLKADAK